VLLPRQQAKLARGAKDKEHAMSQTPNTAIAVIGIDIGKNSFHVVGHDARGAIVLRQKWSRGQVEARLANIPSCLIGMEACVGAHHLSRKLASLGHDARLMPAKYVRPYSKGQKNDFNDAEAIAEAVQRPRSHRTIVRSKSDHLLTGLLFDDAGHRWFRPTLPKPASAIAITCRYLSCMERQRPHQPDQSPAFPQRTSKMSS
jgi:hypothetical protein